MLFKGLDKLKRDAIMAAIVLMIIGILFLIIPQTYITFIGNVTGFAFLVVCAIAIFDFVGSTKALIHYIKLALGLLIGLFGIELFIFDELFVLVLSSRIVGVLPIILGLIEIFYAVVFARRSNRGGWWVLVILSFVLLAAGVCVFVLPFMSGIRAMLFVIGGSLLYSAFISLLSLIWIWPMHKE